MRERVPAADEAEVEQAGVALQGDVEAVVVERDRERVALVEVPAPEVERRLRTGYVRDDDVEYRTESTGGSWDERQRRRREQEHGVLDDRFLRHPSKLSLRARCRCDDGVERFTWIVDVGRERGEDRAYRVPAAGIVLRTHVHR